MLRAFTQICVTCILASRGVSICRKFLVQEHALCRSRKRILLRKLEGRAPDLIILDVMLPGKSGYDILGEIRHDADYASTPVLMLTARGQTRDRELAERAGVNRYMTKPFSNADVLAAVRDLVGT